MGVVCSKPRISKGNQFYSYLYFEIIDPKTLSFKTPVIINLNIKNEKDLDLSRYSLPNILDLIVLYQPSLVPGNESYSRSALYSDSHFISKDSKIKMTKDGQIYKRDLELFKEKSTLFLIGSSTNLKTCSKSSCKIILSLPKTVCDVHLSERFSRLKGQRPEIASSSWGFDLFEMHNANKDSNSLKICSQYSEIQGRETFLLDSEEILTLYSSAKEILTPEQTLERQKRMSIIRGDLAKLDNHGGHMLKESDSVSQNSKKQKLENPENTPTKLSVSDCSEKAKVLLLKMKTEGLGIGPKMQLSSTNVSSKTKKKF